MRYLFIETVLLKPHLETSGEYALDKIKNGDQCSFIYLGAKLPWHEWLVPKFWSYIGFGLDRRLKNFLTLLSINGVEVLNKNNTNFDYDIFIEEIVTWSESFVGQIEDLKKYKFRGVNLGISVASSIISFTKNSNPNLEKFKFELKSLLYSSAMIYMRSLRIIKEINPDIVVTFNGRFATTYPIVAAAKSLNIDVERHERGHSFNYYEIYLESIHNFEYQYLRVQKSWENRSKDYEALAHSFFESRRDGKDQGWYSFTNNQKKNFIPPLTNKKRFVYFSSSDDEFAAIIDKNETGPFETQYEAVEYLSKWSSNQPDVEFIIRLHPHLMKKSKFENQRWLAFSKYGATVIKADTLVDTYALLCSANWIATYGSTIGIESIYWGVPSILVGPAVYRKCPSIYSPSDKDQLNMILDDCVMKGGKVYIPDSYPYGYYYATYGRKFNYYTPFSLADGKFLGHSLNWRPNYVSVFLSSMKKFLKKLGRL